MRDEHDHKNIRHHLSITMRAALDNDEFFLVYQPIVRLSDKRFIGAEALLRWAHPSLGTLLPGQFIDLAEDNELMVPLTAFVIQQACRLVRIWRDDGTDSQPFVSVNVSASSVCHSGFFSLVEGALAATELPAHALQLELTEDAILSGNGAVVTRLQELSALGVGVALDNFDVDSSDFTYLRNFPVNVIKFTGEFIKALDNSTRRNRASEEEITHATSRLAHAIDRVHALGFTATAEHVETSSQAVKLRGLGCDAAQGWHFAKALPADFFSE